MHTTPGAVEREIQALRRERARELRPFVTARWLIPNVVSPADPPMEPAWRTPDKIMEGALDLMLEEGADERR